MRQNTEALNISAEMAGIHAAAYERGREPVRTILDEELALCVLRLELSGAEAVLVAHGHQQAVCSQRDAFEHALAPTLSAAVERATGRTVTTVLSTTQLAPTLTLLTFLFAPRQLRGNA